MDDFPFHRRDLDGARLTDRHMLLVVAFQIPDRGGQFAEVGNGSDDILLLQEHGFAQAPGPLQISVKQRDDLRIVQQGHDRSVPFLVRLQVRFGVASLKKARCQHDLQGKRGCGQDDCQQVVRVQRDGCNQRRQRRIGKQFDRFHLHNLLRCIRPCRKRAGQAKKQ